MPRRMKYASCQKPVPPESLRNWRHHSRCGSDRAHRSSASKSRQYWRDFDALERWARSDPHREWWRQFLRDSGGTGFWHEAYFMRRGMEAVYDDMVKATGFLAFAPASPARGAMFSARGRAARPGSPVAEAPIVEPDFYSGDDAV